MPDDVKGPSATVSEVEAAARQLAMETYITLVNRCADGRLNQAISNGSPFHARVLISKLFEIGKKRIEIVSGSMTDATSAGVDVYGYEPVIAQAKKFLRDPGAVLSILVQCGSVHRGTENRFFDQLISDKDRNGTVELVIADPDGFAESVPHFMVTDGTAYRYEPSTKPVDGRESVVAVGNFGDATFAREINGILLDAYWLSLLQE